MSTVQERKIGTLRYAVENRKQVRAVIRGLSRVFCPHILGLRDSHWHAIVWQFDGYSTIGDLPNWRRFELDEIADIEVIAGPWHRGFKRTKDPQKFEFDAVDSIADTQYLGNIRPVTSSFLNWANWPAGTARMQHGTAVAAS
jgi:predicted DNA-binding transcriptional regulator YafY